MKKIEDHIRKNRDQFDDVEPGAGHFERFAKKLERTESTEKWPNKLWFSYIWRAAAAVLILVAVSVLYNQVDDIRLIKADQPQELPTELVEATNYYARLNHEKINRIDELSKQKPESIEVINIAMHEAEAMDKNSAELKEKYLETKDDRVIDAIITNYRVLGELLDHIIERVRETR